MSHTQTNPAPTADEQLSMVDDAFRRATELRAKLVATKAAAQEAFDRTVNPVQAELDKAVGELRALTDALQEAA